METTNYVRPLAFSEGFEKDGRGMTNPGNACSRVNRTLVELEVGVIPGGAHYLADRVDHNVGSVNDDEVRAVLGHDLFAVFRER